MQYAHFTLGTEVYEHKLSECVIVLALPQQHRWHEPASVISYTYIARLVTFNKAKGCRFNFCLGTAYIALPKGL